MRTMRKTAFKAFLVMLVVSGTTSIGTAQFASEATIRETVRRIQTRTDNLQRAIQNASDRGNYRADDLNRLVLDFETAVKFNRVVQELAVTVANALERPTWNESSFFRRFAAPQHEAVSGGRD